jgi:DNA-binding MarR family transcriptional regulator
MPRRPPPPVADEPALAAWRGLLRAHAALLRALDATLRARHGISVNDYDVLLTLARGQREGTRMTELAERTLLSKSGLTGIVTRLQRAGLVERAPVPGDARGALATLTGRGRRLVEDAHRTQTEVARELIGSRLGDADAASMAELLERIRD